MKKLLSLILAIVLTMALFTSCAEPAEALTSVYLNLGEKYLTDLNYEEAIVYFNKVIEVEPKNARAYLGSAEAYEALGDIDSAISILANALSEFSDDVDVQIEFLERLIELEPANAEWYLNLAQIYINNGDTDTAIEILQNGLEGAEDIADITDLLEQLMPTEPEEEIPEITAEDIGTAINEASVFAWGWFWDNEHTDKTDTIWAPYSRYDEYFTYERVVEEGITTVDDVLALAEQYFTADIAEDIVGYKEWIEQDGVLYVSATEGLGGPGEPNYYEIYAEKASDTLYNVTLYECYSEDEKYQREFTYSYVNGYWVFDTILYYSQEIPVYVLTEPLDEETEEETESGSDSIPFLVGSYMQDHVNWSWNFAGTYRTGTLGETLEISWNYNSNSFDGVLTAENTSNWTVNPAFAISVGDGGYLKLPEGAEIGDTGDSAVYTFTYSDITITATGYDNVVISGGTLERRFTIKQEWGYTSGTSVSIDLLRPILEQTGITLYQFANEYLPNMTNISFEITFVDWGQDEATPSSVYSGNGIVNASVEGAAVIDGVKDSAYASAVALEFAQKGSTNGGSEVLDDPVGRAYIVNDSEYVYVWFEVYDRSLDRSSGNSYEQDSVVFYWMDDNHSYQIRVRYDGMITADYGLDYADKGAEFVAVVTGNGYAVEGRIPITDVKDNMIDMCLQINACSNGNRNYTCFILGNDDGDNAYMRTSRSSEHNVWWVLKLAGEFEDTRE